jgi:FKBP-type peptidyl-prolyl cis-trans isomerase FklB
MLSQKLRFLTAAILCSVSFQSALAADKPATTAAPTATTTPAATATTTTSTLTSEADKISYSIGVDIGQSFRKQNIEINSDLFMTGLKDGQNDKQTLLNKEDIYQTLITLQNRLAKQQVDMLNQQAKENLTKGQDFLAKNKTATGIKTTASGLQYRVIKEGNGTAPKPNDIVTTHYRGHLIDGTEFDSSYKRKEPATFAVNAVIPGWTEALQLMKAGSKYELFIPAELAYGAQGIGRIIGPNETLIFEIELIDVKAGDTANAPQSKATNNNKHAQATSSKINTAKLKSEPATKQASITHKNQKTAQK